MHSKFKFMDDSSQCVRSFLCNCIARQWHKTKILLFIHQCAAHPRDTIALKNIKVILFSPNCTSHLQPLDMGIIHAFKCQYSKELTQKTVAIIYRDYMVMQDHLTCEDEEKQEVEEKLIENKVSFFMLSKD